MVWTGLTDWAQDDENKFAAEAEAASSCKPSDCSSGGWRSGSRQLSRTRFTPVWFRPQQVAQIGLRPSVKVTGAG